MAATTDYLVTLAQAWSSGRQERIPAPPGLDREAFCALLAAHQVECAFAPLLDEVLLSPMVTDQVAEACHRTSFLLLELERVLGTISTPDCEPVILKGAGLALNWYRRPQDRWFVDLDLLVPREQVIPSCERLLALGYRYFRGGIDLSYYDQYHLHRVLVSPQGAFVEVHWDLTLPQSVYGYDVPGVFARARTVALGRRQIQIASAVDQVLHGVYQHIADGFQDLKRFLDLSLLLPELTDSDWLFLVKESRRTRMNLALGASLKMYQVLMGGPIPEGILPQLEAGPVVGRILRGLDLPQVCLKREAVQIQGYNTLLHLLLIPKAHSRLRELGNLIWPKQALVHEGTHYPQPLPSLLRRVKLGAYYLRNLMGLTGMVVKAYKVGQ